MNTEKRRQYCPECRKHVLAERRIFGLGEHLFHITISVLTGGIWLFLYFLVILGMLAKPYLCPCCGQKTKRKRKD